MPPSSPLGRRQVGPTCRGHPLPPADPATADPAHVAAHPTVYRSPPRPKRMGVVLSTSSNSSPTFPAKYGAGSSPTPPCCLSPLWPANLPWPATILPPYAYKNAPRSLSPIFPSFLSSPCPLSCSSRRSPHQPLTANFQPHTTTASATTAPRHHHHWLHQREGKPGRCSFLPHHYRTTGSTTSTTSGRAPGHFRPRALLRRLRIGARKPCIDLLQAPPSSSSPPEPRLPRER